jgi:predicted nucleotidyltransferase component of viral defense system
VSAALEHSIADRLVNLAHQQGEHHTFVLMRYGLERFLYRLGQSPLADRFILKGAALFWLWQGSGYRTTKDLDFLAFGDPSQESLAKAVRSLCAIDTLEADGLRFLAESVQCEPIREGQAYEGVRVRLLAMLGRSRIDIQLDVAFGDSAWPPPERVHFPSLLEMPSPWIRAYCDYTAAAEKLHAISVLGVANTRMKDFYDLLLLLRLREFKAERFRETVARTFLARGTPTFREWPVSLTEAFSNHPEKVRQWKAFAGRQRLGVPIGTLAEVIVELRNRLAPLLATEPSAST